MELLEEWIEIKKEMDSALTKLAIFGAKINPDALDGISTEQFVEQLHKEMGTTELEGYLKEHGQEILKEILGEGSE